VAVVVCGSEEVEEEEGLSPEEQLRARRMDELVKERAELKELLSAVSGGPLA
jgi:hypothetical protein